MTQAEKSKLFSENKCLNCKKEGHFAKECPLKKGNAAAPKAETGTGANVKTVKVDKPSGKQYDDWELDCHQEVGSPRDGESRRSDQVSITKHNNQSEANNRIVSVIRAGKSVETVLESRELDDGMELDLEENSLMFIDAFSNSHSRLLSVFPSIDSVLSSSSQTQVNVLSSRLDSLSLVRKRKGMEDMDAIVSKKRAKEDMEEKRLKDGGHRFRVPVVISWVNKYNESCSRNVFALVDTGADITIINARVIIDQLMPWRHRPTPIKMSDASGNRLRKSGKVIVNDIDLKVQDARTNSFRTFRPHF